MTKLRKLDNLLKLARVLERMEIQNTQYPIREPVREVYNDLYEDVKNHLRSPSDRKRAKR